MPKPLKTVESILTDYKIGFVVGDKDVNLHIKGLVKALDAHYYQLMLSLLPSQSKYKTVDSYKKAIRQKLSEHFNGEGGTWKSDLV